MSANSNLNFAGIYLITNLATGRVYVGQAVNFRKRWGGHIWWLNRGEHDNSALQADWKKYGGKKGFKFSVYLDLSHLKGDELRDALDEHEERVRRMFPNPYNLTQVVPGLSRFSDETRAKLSAERKSRWADPEYRAKTVATMKEKAKDIEFQAIRGAAIKAAKKESARAAKAGAESAARWADPEFKAARAAERRAHWQDPEYRARQTEARKAAWVRRRAKAATKP